jgi:hypothetical protein
MAIIITQVSSKIAMAVIMLMEVEVVVVIIARITKTSNLRRNSSNLKRESGRLLHHK